VEGIVSFLEGAAGAGAGEEAEGMEGQFEGCQEE